MPGQELIANGIADGSIDTVVLAFPDMHGRPVGKRVTPDFFSAHVAEHGIEVCDYLLAVDIDTVSYTHLDVYKRQVTVGSAT